MSDDLGYLVERMKVRLEETEGARQAEAEQSSSSQAVDEVLAELKAARENPKALSGSGATCSPRAMHNGRAGSCFAGCAVDAFDATLFAKATGTGRVGGGGVAPAFESFVALSEIEPAGGVGERARFRVRAGERRRLP